MDVKKHFWVDYLACLIFGAVIVPLWYYGRWPNMYCTTSFLLAVTLFASVHVVCFWILGLFVRRKGARLFLLYLFWGFGWFLCPVLIKLSPHFLVLFPVLHAYRWWCFSSFSLLSAVFLIFVSQRCSGSSRLLRAVSVFVYMWFVVVACFARRNVSSLVPYVPGPVSSSVNYPNIYHILLDAHANRKGLERLGGDLKPFYRKLEDLGFVTYPESKSVYTRTDVSVCSMWHMDAECHIRGGLHNNAVWRNLSSRGYKIREYTSGVLFYPKAISYHEARLDFQKMIVGTIWFHTFLGSKAWLKEGLMKSHRFVLQKLEEAKGTYGSCANFFYGHILSPHGPFVYSSEVNVKGLIDGDWPDVNVSRHMMCREHNAIDDLTLETVKRILKQYKGEFWKPIIVLHSDHGAVRHENLLESGNPYVTEDTVYGNLFAIYMPDEWKKDAKDLKFINLYRFIFNHLFGTNYEYLPDVRKNPDGSIFKEKTLSPSEQ